MCVAGLLGVAAGMFVCGLVERLSVVFGPGVSARGTALMAAVFAIALGIRVPQQLALWLYNATWRRLWRGERRSDNAQLLIGVDHPDRPLYWVVLSVITLLTGVLAATLPVTATIGAACYAWFQTHFVWSTLPLLILQLLVGLSICLWPAVGLGLSIACVHHVSCRHGRWNADATGWVLIGVAGGTAAAMGSRGPGVGADLLLLAAALPILLATIVSVASGSRECPTDRGAVEEDAPPLPTWSDRWPTLLRGGVVFAGVCAAGTLALTRHGATAVGAHLPPPAGIGWLALGVGVLAGNRTRRDGSRSIGGFGVACAAAGVVVMAGTIASVTTAHAPCHPSWFAFAGLLAIGFAAAYGQQVVLNRVARRARVGASVLMRIVGFGALVAWAGTPLAAGSLGDATSFALLALCLVGLGGMLIIHEPDHSPRARRVRLCGIFTALAAMIILMPPPRAATESTRDAPPAALSPNGAPAIR